MTGAEMAEQRERELNDILEQAKATMAPAFELLMKQFAEWLRGPTPGLTLAIAHAFEVTIPKLRIAATAHAWMITEIKRLRGEPNA